MKNKDLKPAACHDKSSRKIPIALIFTLLCGFSFYLGSLFCSDKNKLLINGITRAAHSPKEASLVSLQAKPVVFPECSSDYQDYTPCTDPKRWKKYGSHRLTFLERHCPPIFERKECLVPQPKGYKTPIKWPKSKDECWYRNVPYDWINNQKSNQHWLRKEGEKFLFPGGGTMFPRGVGAYVDLMQDLIPGMKDGTVRTAIDTGCGVASWGGDLLDRGILTVSLAPRDNHEAQVQFALERGIPAILGIISTQRLPFPSSSFDMAHCSRCLIPWTEFGGIYLLEIHRILRPGGFWVLSGPPVNYKNRWRGWNTTVEEQKSDYNKLQKLLSSMCFKLYDQKEDISVWKKSSDNSCSDKLLVPDAYPPKCDDSTEPDAAWYTPLRSCLVTPSQEFKKLNLESTPKWPDRLHIAPERISTIPGGSASAFKHDDSKWKVRVKHYKTLLPALGTDKIRNVMDMNTEYGGFAAALIDDPIWVMNVVSSYGTNSLSVVYDRGLIGTYHDWCEAFSTYPRTYDLLHFDGLFTAESHSSAYEEVRFCETFHSEASGWRNCEPCGKRVHCGCIASMHAFTLLDMGGVECVTCARKNFITGDQKHLVLAHLFDKPCFLGLLAVQEKIYTPPEQYILKRWTRYARVDDSDKSMCSVFDGSLLARHGDLSYDVANIIDEASLCKEAYHHAKLVLQDLKKSIREINEKTLMAEDDPKRKNKSARPIERYLSPKHAITKGRPKRLKSSKEKARKKDRVCRRCGKRGVAHDRRNCLGLDKSIAHGNSEPFSENEASERSSEGETLTQLDGLVDAHVGSSNI